jgi:hypothetical protein
LIYAANLATNDPRNKNVERPGWAVNHALMLYFRPDMAEGFGESLWTERDCPAGADIDEPAARPQLGAVGRVFNEIGKGWQHGEEAVR